MIKRVQSDILVQREVKKEIVKWKCEFDRSFLYKNYLQIFREDIADIKRK